MNVLIAEDERPIARAIGRLVEQHPACTLAAIAPNGQAALDILRKTPIDLVITDIQMPVMTGLELMAVMQEEFPQCLCVVLTGFSQFEYARTALQYHALDYLLKSITREDLFRVLDHALEIWKQQCFVQQRSLLQFALAGNTVVSNTQFYAMLFSGVCAVPSDIFDGRFHCFPQEANLLLLVEADCFSLEQARSAYQHACQDASVPIRLICTDSPVPVQSLPVTVRQLHQLLECNAKLFCSSFLEGRSSRQACNQQNFLSKTRPERAVEAICTRQMQPLSDYLFQMLQTAVVHGGYCTDAMAYLHAVFNDNRILASALPEQLQAVRDTVKDILFTADNPQSCAQQLFQVLCSLQSESETARDLQEIVEEISRFLETNYHLRYSTEGLAKQYHLAPSYLNKIFKKYKGVRPSEYLLHIRMNRAATMLRTMPNVRIKDVAASVGYPDPHYFSNLFRKTTGQWPSDVQQEMKSP